jgi:NADPH:quinone reductase-like Zn-dependent oxidoreductase
MTLGRAETTGHIEVMNHLVLTKFDGKAADNVRLEPVPDRTRAAGEALVAIEAATINPSDISEATGRYYVRPELPAPIGNEAVGRVLEADDPALAGRRVLVLPNYEQGLWADRVFVAERNLVVVPEDADAVQLAMTAVNPATAYLLLTRYVDLKPGDWIGQNLGNSAVGQYVIALAKRAGVRTLSVVRRQEAADQIPDGDVVLVDGDDLGARIAGALGGARLRLVLDGAADATSAALARSLEFGGTMAGYSTVTGGSPAIGVVDYIFREVVVRGFWLINWVRSAPRDEVARVYAELAGLVAEGVLHADVEATYPLVEYRAALEHTVRAHRGGKIVFLPERAR